MPLYKVQHYNGESGMLHSQHEVYAADQDSAIAEAEKCVCEENGYGTSADGGQVVMAKPRFRVAVSEVEAQ